MANIPILPAILKEETPLVIKLGYYVGEDKSAVININNITSIQCVIVSYSYITTFSIMGIAVVNMPFYYNNTDSIVIPNSTSTNFYVKNTFAVNNTRYTYLAFCTPA